jgi:catechol 2,3-dioxygenase-like lactoylglutathione lyase family enzyme
MKSLAGLILLCGIACAEDLPLLGLAHVSIRVSDLEKARAFYGGVLGLEEAFDIPRDDGVLVAYFKVNDHQFIEISPGLTPAQVVPMSHIAMYTDNIVKLRKMIAGRGVAATEIEKAGFSIRALPGQRLEYLEFLQYQPDSPQVRSAGKFLGKRRLSTHLEHAGIVTTGLDAAYKFYVDTLGFTETWHRNKMLFHLRLPGGGKDYVELSNLESVADLARARAGTAAHCSLEVADIQAAYREALTRTGMKDLKPPRFGLDERWQFNLFDPDGTRVELMQPRDPAKAGTPVPSVN